MLRKLHSLPGLIGAILLIFMATTGGLLSLAPAIEHFTVGLAPATLSVAELAQAVATAHPDVQSIVHNASGAVIAYSGGGAASLIDPATGATVGAYQPPAFFTWLTELHRSLFLGDAGRVVAGIGALALAVLAASGVAMLVSRLGGWRRLFAAAKGTLSQRLHVEISRMAIVGLALSALTGLYMSLVTFGFVADGPGGFGPLPPTGNGGAVAAISELSALKDIPLSQLRELTFPAAGDVTDVFSVTTSAGQGFVDQSTGEMLKFVANDATQTLYETIYALHTGQGLWWVGLLLGFAALAIPVLATTGTLIWLARRQSRPRIRNNAAAQQADVVLLVGSESGATWGFAATLHAALTEAGRRVHVAPMNGVAKGYHGASQILVLTSTYGNGSAPQNAGRFLKRIGKMAVPEAHYAVLGFGDHSFQHYAAFGAEVDAALAAKGWSRLMPMAAIDRQSGQAFADWGRELGQLLGLGLDLNHQVVRPRTTGLSLVGRVDYGTEIQAPTSVLRFVATGGSKALARHRPGDLLGILVPGSDVPRYYSLASSGSDGFVEICVSKQPGGLASGYLCELEPGGVVEGFIRANPDFRPQHGSKPVVMIGNGTGIAPFVGLIWANRRHRPMHLYWGGRQPDADFLYEDTMRDCLTDGRLSSRHVAFSRVADRHYVQDEVAADADRIARLVNEGAQFMVCGSNQMARGVAEAIDRILQPLGESIAHLREKGRYLEDVY